MPINRICHIADLHFQNYSRQEEYKAVSEAFFYLMRERVQPDRIIITGDLVQSKNNISPELIYNVGGFLKECASICKTVVTLGNHDFLIENKNRMDAITPIIYLLENENILFYDEPGVYPDENINWVVYSLKNYNARPIEENFKRIDGMKYYGLFHGIIQGAKNALDYTFEEGTRLSEFQGLDAVFCGDIHHRAVYRTPDNKPIIMVGSFIQQRYDEKINDHGFCVFNVNEGTYEFQDIDNNIKFLHYKISDIRDLEDEGEILIN